MSNSLHYKNNVFFVSIGLLPSWCETPVSLTWVSVIRQERKKLSIFPLQSGGTVGGQVARHAALKKCFKLKKEEMPEESCVLPTCFI